METLELWCVDEPLSSVLGRPSGALYLYGISLIRDIDDVPIGLYYGLGVVWYA